MTYACIAFDASETHAFEKHYYELVVHPVPFPQLLESLTARMLTYGKPKFKVPAYYSSIEKKLISFFAVDEETPGAKVYNYRRFWWKRKSSNNSSSEFLQSTRDTTPVALN